MTKRVFVVYDLTGIPVYFADDDVDLYVVDSRCPDDQVFKVSNVRPTEELARLVEEVRVGHGQDARQKKLEADLMGVSHLKDVSDDGDV